MRIDQKSQAQEHDDLEQPCQSVHKGIYFFPIHNLGVTHHHSGYVDSQIAVSLQQVGKGEGEEHECQQQNRVERLVIDVDSVQDEDGQFSQQIAGAGSDDELYEERAQYVCRFHPRRLDELYQHDGKHVGHRVVTSAFQFEHGTQVVPQVYLLRTQYGEYGGRIGRRHGSGQQQAGDKREVNVGPAHARKPPDEESGE